MDPHGIKGYRFKLLFTSALRYFTHASEHLIWASKTKKSKHTFNDPRPSVHSQQTQTTSVWKDIWHLPSVESSEKFFGKHPTQKPEALIKRAVLASSCAGDLVFDPFCGSGTTAVVCKQFGRKFVGIDNNLSYLDIEKRRLEATS